MTYAQIAKMKPKVCLTLVSASDALKNNEDSKVLSVHQLTLSHNKSTKSMKTITNIKEKMSSAVSNLYHIQEAKYYHEKA